MALDKVVDSRMVLASLYGKDPTGILTSVGGFANNADSQSAAYGYLGCRGLMLFNGSDWDRAYGNVDLTVLPSAARSATTVSAEQMNINARGVIIYLNITAVPGVDTVTLVVEGKDPVSHIWDRILDSDAKSTTGMFLYAVYPGIADTDLKFDAFEEMPLPRMWRVKMIHSGAGSFTYSVGASVIW